MSPPRALFNLILACTLSLNGSSASHAADLNGRDATISRITRAQLNTAFLVQGYMSGTRTLEFIRQTNPGLSDAEWKAIAAEVGGIMAEGMSKPGNPMFVAYQTLLEPLSDTELAKLDILLADPLYRRFSAMLTTETGQRVITEGAIENAPFMPVTLNFVLRKHGLKEVH